MKNFSSPQQVRSIDPKPAWNFPPHIQCGTNIDTEYIHALQALSTKTPSEDLGILSAWSAIHSSPCPSSNPMTNPLPFDSLSHLFTSNSSDFFEDGRDPFQEQGNIQWLDHINLPNKDIHTVIPEDNSSPDYNNVLDPTYVMSFDIADFVSTPSCETFLDHQYIPPDVSSDDKTVVCSNQIKDINFSDVVWPKQQYAGDLYQFYGEIKAHLDTGAKVTVSNLQYILHNYKPYTRSFKCPVQLVGAIDEANVVYPE